jgi:hypothetical protein
MKAYAIVAAVLIVVGILGLVYGQFSYTKESQGATLGPIKLSINEKKTVNIPVWVGGGSIVLGAGVLGFALMKHKALL